MEDTIRQRIKHILSTKKSNPTKFSSGDTAMQKRLSRQLNGGAAITFETISNILSSFPDISAEWLLRGKEPMFNTESETSDIKAGDMQKVYETVVGDKDEQIEKLKAEINQLIGENNIMREQLGIAARKVSNKSA